MGGYNKCPFEGKKSKNWKREGPIIKKMRIPTLLWCIYFLKFSKNRHPNLQLPPLRGSYHPWMVIVFSNFTRQPPKFCSYHPWW